MAIDSNGQATRKSVGICNVGPDFTKLANRGIWIFDRSNVYDHSQQTEMLMSSVLLHPQKTVHGMFLYM